MQGAADHNPEVCHIAKARVQKTLLCCSKMLCSSVFCPSMNLSCSASSVLLMGCITVQLQSTGMWKTHQCSPFALQVIACMHISYGI